MPEGTFPGTSMSEFGIHTIDTGFQRAGLVASHLLVEQGRAAFIDVGVEPGIPVLLDALDQQGLALEQVDYVIVTHVHLDHAGAAGRLMQQLPNARLVVHPRGARHMIDPSRLIAGAAAVYGEEHMEQQFGRIVPVDAGRVIEADDGSLLELAGRELLFLDTPGHARHHFCVCDHRSRGIFTGDTFGLSYRQLDTVNGPFIMPTTSPVQFDPVAMHASIDRLMSLHPERVYLTHFGRVDKPAPLAAQLHRDIDDFVAMADAVRNEDNREDQLTVMMRSWLGGRLEKHGISEIDKALEFLDMDVGLNVAGLLCWLAC
jgi:glyoxylase-like metal-dependent hydrolase (beta-lactamase superfamily II)